MRFYLVVISPRGYSARESFAADCHIEASRRHLEAWHALQAPYALVMRTSTGRRFSVSESASTMKDATE